MKLIFTLAIITALVIVYAVFVRPWLREKAWASWFFRLVEPIELHLWRKSEALLVGRWFQFVGLLSTVHGFLGQIDWTLMAILTPDWIDPYLPAMPLILNILGWVIELLRKDTTKPLELVAVPEVKPPEVEEKIKAAEVAKVEAIAAVQVAKVEGQV